MIERVVSRWRVRVKHVIDSLSACRAFAVGVQNDWKKHVAEGQLRK
jgi:hypothetical protein